MWWTKEDELYGANALGAAYHEAPTLSLEEKVRRVLGAVRGRPIAAPLAFEVTGQLTSLAYRLLSESDVHKSLCESDVREALEAVSAALGKAQSSAGYARPPVLPIDPEDEAVVDRLTAEAVKGVAVKRPIEPECAKAQSGAGEQADWSWDDAQRFVDAFVKHDGSVYAPRDVLDALRECFPRKPQAASSELERAKAFELTAEEREAMHGQIEHNAPHTRVGMVARALLRAERAKASEQDDARVLHGRDTWHEDDGDVVWWKLPITEPPYVGTPLDTDFPEYATHWTRLLMPFGWGPGDGARKPERAKAFELSELEKDAVRWLRDTASRAPGIKDYRNDLIQALERAQATLAPTEHAKAFELTADEKEAYARAVDYAECDRGSVSMDDAAHLTYALDRALRTLGPTERERELEAELDYINRQLTFAQSSADAFSAGAHARSVELAAEKKRADGLQEQLDHFIRDRDGTIAELEAELAAAKGRERELERELEVAHHEWEKAAGSYKAADEWAHQLKAELAAAKERERFAQARAHVAEQALARYGTAERELCIEGDYCGDAPPLVERLRATAAMLHKAQERIKELESSEPAGDKLAPFERAEVEALRKTISNPQSTKAMVIAVIDRLAPKPAPKSALEELLAEMRAAGSYSSTLHWIDKLEAIKADQERGR